MSDPIRLAKRLTELVACSRSEAEQYIAGGFVTVDGVITEDPASRVAAEQMVALAPEAKLGTLEPVTILLHKPAGMLADEAVSLITPENQMAGDRSGIHFLRHHLRHLTLTDRLEDQASGLLVYTQDWRTVRKLVEEAPRNECEYIVEVAGQLDAAGLQRLNHGLRFNNKELPPIKVSWQNETRLRFALKTPPRGLIPHMCEQVGLQIISMKRLRIGRLSMSALPAGQWRYLLGYEKF